MSKHLPTSEEVEIRDSGIAVPLRKHLKFVGADVADDALNARTVVTPSGGGSSEIYPVTLTYQSAEVTTVGTAPQWGTDNGATSYLDFRPDSEFAIAEFDLPEGLPDSFFDTFAIMLVTRSMNVVPDDTFFYIYLEDTNLGTVARWTYTPQIGYWTDPTLSISVADTGQYDKAGIVTAYNAGRLKLSLWAGGGSGAGAATDALHVTYLAVTTTASLSVRAGGDLGFVRYAGGPYTISNVSGSYVNAGDWAESGGASGALARSSGSQSWLNMSYSGPNTSLWYFSEHGLYRYTLSVTFTASASLASSSQIGISAEVFCGTQNGTATSYRVKEGVRIHRSHATDALTTWSAYISITDYFGPGDVPGESGIINTQYIRPSGVFSLPDVYTETWIARLL